MQFKLTASLTAKEYTNKACCILTMNFTNSIQCTLSFISKHKSNESDSNPVNLAQSYTVVPRKSKNSWNLHSSFNWYVIFFFKICQITEAWMPCSWANFVCWLTKFKTITFLGSDYAWPVPRYWSDCCLCTPRAQMPLLFALVSTAHRWQQVTPHRGVCRVCILPLQERKSLTQWFSTRVTLEADQY